MKFPSGLPLASLALLSGLLTVAACKKDSDIRANSGARLPQAINFVQPGLYPEGTQYDSQSGRFLVSSQTTGRIGQVTGDSTEQGTYTYTTFADNSQLISTIGLNLDASHNRLLAAVSDPGYNQDRTTPATRDKLAALAIFNRSTGTLGQFIRLSDVSPSTYTVHFANDIAIDAQGNAYVTDSYAPIIYKVTFDAVTGQGTASPWLTSSALQAPAGMFGLNGIVYHPSGYLLVAKSDEGKLLKIRIVNNNPGALTTVAVPTGLSLLGDDGLQLVDNTTLHVVCNAQGKVYRLKTTTDFDSVTTTGTFDANVAGVSPYPTTLARRIVSGPGLVRDTVASYVLYSHLDALQANKMPPVNQFTLRQIKFK
jgi:sugar lactone lactonase YvrE